MLFLIQFVAFLFVDAVTLIDKITALFEQIISTDARNHGDSPHSEEMDYNVMAQDVTKLVADLGHKKVTLMGHSMGGKTMMTIALNNVSLCS